MFDRRKVLDRERELRNYDLAMFAAASNYDLEEPAERQRSASDLARFFFRTAQSLKPDLFVECGAKDAGSSRRARRYLGEGPRIIAFEANPYTYERFRGGNPPESAVEYLHLALSDEPGQVTFNVRLREGGSPRADGHGSLLPREPGYGYDFEQVTVEATTLDHHLADVEVESCALWIDVEGASEQVLRGGERTLTKAAILIIEVEDGHFWQDAWRRPDVLGFLYDLGMVPIARDFEYRYQNNLVFVRETLLDSELLRFRLAQHLSASASGRPVKEQEEA